MLLCASVAAVCVSSRLSHLLRQILRALGMFDTHADASGMFVAVAGASDASGKSAASVKQKVRDVMTIIVVLSLFLLVPARALHNLDDGILLATPIMSFAPQSRSSNGSACSAFRAMHQQQRSNSKATVETATSLRQRLSMAATPCATHVLPGTTPMNSGRTIARPSRTSLTSP